MDDISGALGEEEDFEYYIYNLMTHYNIGDITVDDDGENPMMCMSGDGISPNDWEPFDTEELFNEKDKIAQRQKKILEEIYKKSKENSFNRKFIKRIFDNGIKKRKYYNRPYREPDYGH